MRLMTIVALAMSVGFSGPIFGNTLEDSNILTIAPVDQVFVPRTFDENDRIQIVLRGSFPNGCYSKGPTLTYVDLAHKKIALTPEAYFSAGRICTQMILPYIETVELAESLPVGVYTVEIPSQPHLEAVTLTVKRSLDEDTKEDYADVKKASVLVGTNGDTELVLEGRHPFVIQGCVRITAINSSVSDYGSNIVLIEPYTAIEQDNSLCENQNPRNHFKEKVILTEFLTRGDYLIHVKTMNNGSIYEYVTIK